MHRRDVRQALASAVRPERKPVVRPSPVLAQPEPLASPPMIVALDGVDGVGKTTVAQHLANRVNYLQIPEFTSTPLGAMLQTAVRVRPGGVLSSPIAQALVFMADHQQRMETAARESARGCIVDRGTESKLVYQTQLLREQTSLRPSEISSLLTHITAHTPPADHSLLLTADSSDLRRRIGSQQGESVSSEWLSFLETAQSVLISRRPGLSIVDTTDKAIDEVVEACLACLDSLHARDLGSSW